MYNTRSCCGVRCSAHTRRTTKGVLRTATRRYRVCSVASSAGSGAGGDGVVVVAGATGGVGQLVTAKLVEKGYAVRALVRDLEKAKMLFAPSTSSGVCDRLEIVCADARRASEVNAAFNSAAGAASVRGVIDCTGTTAFPSTRWQGGGGPSDTSLIVSNLVAAAVAASTVKRYVFVSSIGVERRDAFPFSILNLFGALEHKAIGEAAVRDSGLDYCILRAARLTDGPYTSYDINTLLRATAGTRNDVIFSSRDDFSQEETSRITLADACVAALDASDDGSLCNTTLSVASIEGDGPGLDVALWEERARAAL